MEGKVKLTFCGGVGSTAGINFLLEVENKKILIDAGLYANSYDYEEINKESFSYNPAEIDFVFISQYQIESIGKLPKLVKEGFKGKIYSTPETKFISELILLDFLREEKKAKLIFDESDIKNTMALWEEISYGESLHLGDKLNFQLFDSGHIAGSSMINLNYKDKNMLFANAVGNSFKRKSLGFEKDYKFDYLVIESIYGNKVHEDAVSRKEHLENIIEETVNRQGTVFFPISSIDKIYTILLEVRELIEGGRIPKIPIFVDSLLASETIDIYGKLFKCQEEEIACKNLEVFLKNFKEIKFVVNDEDVKKMDNSVDPKIIIGEIDASSKKTRKNIIQYLSNPNDSIVFVDYQPVGSFGKKLQQEPDFLEMDGKKIKILSEIETIDGYSTHADHNGLFMFVDDFRQSLKQVFVVIGEPQSSMFFAQKLRDYMGVNAKCPQKYDSCELDF